MKKKNLIKRSFQFSKNFILLVLITVILAVVFLFITAKTLNYFVKSGEKVSWDELYKGRLAKESVSPQFTAFNTVQPYLAEERNTIESSGALVDIKVSFTSQTPLGVWDEIHKETCEEAVVIMVNTWRNDLAITPELVEKEILKLVQWQKNNFGFFGDTTAELTAKFAKEVYGLKSSLIYDPTVEQIKRELKNGNLVVMGMAGKKLKNPFFKPPGPVYHMLLFRGYDDKGFFVNDPGTKRGDNFYYTFENIKEAAHDWSGSEETLLDSPPVAIIFSE